jgi:hypothetical protein
MKLVRKSASEEQSMDLVGTMINPFQGMRGFGGKVYVPDWFRLSGNKEPGQLEKVMAKTLLLGGTYGAGAFGLKYLLNSLERKKEAQTSSERVQSAVKAAMPVISPDADLRDQEEEEKLQSIGLEEEQEALRELEKNAEENDKPGVIKQQIAATLHGVQPPGKATLTGSMKALLAVAALGSFGAGAVLTKQWADDRDENRQRLKEAEKAAKLRALQERPPTVVGEFDPEVKAALDAHIKGGRLKVRPRSADIADTPRSNQLPSGTLEEQEIDPTDSLAQNIAVV